MNEVVMHNVVSVDGFIADEADGIGHLFDWYFAGDVPAGETGFTVSPQSAAYLESVWAETGCLIIGRHLFDLMNGWDGIPPAGIPHVVVVSHRPKPDGWHPEASYFFVDDPAGAVQRARELAGGRNVGVAAGDVGAQMLAAGLVDRVAMDVAPVLFGSGKRFFGALDEPLQLEDPDVVIRGEGVLHLAYRVQRG
ncbi:dihydrofolate reductase family protein [Agromyces aurantiacus]|uniref:Dihydrofolate reductase family protein n=1 Tax=Agromyces aurantiacus TaxID=165814 RepID=A0ABV9R998_9MICO|nr:dihydrofolate reductase family protein [Agromyces aurantiacus]MBM7503590.1 dihydrofolate reductase [Agromyces aurantiacus]